MRSSLLVVSILVGLSAACSSSSTPAPATDTGTVADTAKDSAGDADVCGFTDAMKVTSVTKVAGSDALCPDMKPSDLTSTGDSGTGDSGSSCEPVIDTKACTATINCTEAGSEISGTFSKDGATLKGRLTVKIITATTITCQYDIVIS